MKFEQEVEISFKQIDELESKIWLAMMRLRSEVFVVEQECIYLDPDPTDLKSIHVLVMIDSQLVAYSRLYRPDTWHIGRIIVAKKHRGTGLGRWMMQEVLNWLNKEQTATPIVMSAQVYLSEFYRQLGFVIKGNMYLEDGIPHIRMELG